MTAAVHCCKTNSWALKLD